MTVIHFRKWELPGDELIYIYIVVVIVVDAIFGPSFLFSSITEYVDFLEGDANHFALLDS